MKGNLPAQPPSSYRSRFDQGTEGIQVHMLNPPDPNLAAEVVAVFAETTFGDVKDTSHYRGTYGGADEAWALAQGAAEFKHVIPNALETVSLTFTVEGISRATTHQLVRTRVGAGFGQFSQRANNLSGFNMRLPESFGRMNAGAVQRYHESLEHLRRFYDAAIAAGVPYQDARYVVPEGVETSITMTYNLLALIGTIKRRICNRMQWEVNYVARLMADQATFSLPWLGKALRAGCERGTCQTVDPMFEPSCQAWNGTKVEWAKDSPALLEQMGEAPYNWPRASNGCSRFYEADRERLAVEARNPELTMSVGSVKPHLWLRKDEQGLWRRSNG